MDLAIRPEMPLKLHQPVRHTLGVALLAAYAAHAAADTLLLRYAAVASALVSEVDLPLGKQSYHVGNHTIQMQAPATSFIAYCIDPFQYATTAYTSYQRAPLASFLSASTQQFAEVTALFSHSYAATLGNATKAAGFQLALWEVFNEDANLATGQVRLTANTNAAAATEAQSLLAGLASSTWTTPATAYELTVYSSATRQDFIAASAIPEPEIPLLILAGLLVLGVAARGRQLRAGLQPGRRLDASGGHAISR